MADGSSFLTELKRRHVWRVVIAYVVAAWLVVQVATQLFPFFHIPGWAVRLVVLLLVLGFPVVVGLTWAFEITPEGVRRTAPAGAPDARTEPQHRDIGRKLDVAIVALLVLAIGIAGWRVYADRRAHAAAPAIAMAPAAAPARPMSPAAHTGKDIPAKSIAVLPFENLSSEKDNAYFADGMQDLILTKLADVGDLKVISRTSTMQYKSYPDDLKTIGRQLGVATILEGSVQKAGNQVLINVQLIDARTDNHLWAKSYTRTLDNIFGVEGEVAGEIAAALHARLSPAQHAVLAKAPTTDKAAYDAFLRAEDQYDRGNVNADFGAIKTAVELYRKAVTEDPRFALAFARLSRAESRLAFAGGAGADTARLTQQAQADAEEALRLQPDLPAAHLALGYSAYWGHRNYTAALKAFVAVLALRPNDAEALTAQGFVQRRQGHFDAAIASLRRAVTIDPHHFSPVYELANTYMMAGRYADAENGFQRALALEPDSVVARGGYAMSIVFGSGDVPRALAMVQGDDPALKRVRAMLLTYQRKFPQAIALVEGIPDTPAHFEPGSSKAWQLGVLYWEAGERDRARAWFAKALPQERAALAKVQGLGKSTVWNGVGADEFGIGNTAAGLAAAAKSEAILARSHDAIQVPSFRLGDAIEYALMAGRADLAVPLLVRALAAPGIGRTYAPVMLWLDPAWDPIRHDLAFQALLKKYAKYKPAVTYDNPPAS